MNIYWCNGNIPKAGRCSDNRANFLVVYSN